MNKKTKDVLWMVSSFVGFLFMLFTIYVNVVDKEFSPLAVVGGAAVCFFLGLTIQTKGLSLLEKNLDEMREELGLPKR